MKGFILALVLTIFLVTSGNVSASPPRQAVFEVVTVIGVIDGDTIDVQFEDGRTERVRYIGINTPEAGEPCFAEAKNANAVLVDGKTIVMIRDASNWDSSGRLLRYVFFEGTFVNAELVAHGWAEAVQYPPDVTFAGVFEYLDTQARDANLGCHASRALDALPTSTLPTATAIQASAVTVSSSNSINLRSGPGTNYPTVSTLPAGSANVRAVGRNATGDWLVLADDSWVATWVVTVSGDVNSLPVHSAPAAPAAPVAPAAPAAPPVRSAPQATAQPAAPGFTCNCSKTCTQMESCNEAYFQLQQCGCTERDSDGDGVPCESICLGG